MPACNNASRCHSRRRWSPYALRSDLSWGIIGTIYQPLAKDNDEDEIGVSHRIHTCEVWDTPNLLEDTSRRIKKTCNFSIETQVKEVINLSHVIQMFETDFSERRAAKQVSLSQDDITFLKNWKTELVGLKTDIIRCLSPYEIIHRSCQTTSRRLYDDCSSFNPDFKTTRSIVDIILHSCKTSSKSDMQRRCHTNSYTSIMENSGTYPIMVCITPKSLTRSESFSIVVPRIWGSHSTSIFFKVPT